MCMCMCMYDMLMCMCMRIHMYVQNVVACAVVWFMVCPTKASVVAERLPPLLVIALEPYMVPIMCIIVKNAHRKA